MNNQYENEDLQGNMEHVANDLELAHTLNLLEVTEGKADHESSRGEPIQLAKADRLPHVLLEAAAQNSLGYTDLEVRYLGIFGLSVSELQSITPRQIQSLQEWQLNRIHFPSLLPAQIRALTPDQCGSLGIGAWRFSNEQVTLLSPAQVARLDLGSGGRVKLFNNDQVRALTSAQMAAGSLNWFTIDQIRLLSPSQISHIRVGYDAHEKGLLQALSVVQVVALTEDQIKSIKFNDFTPQQLRELRPEFIRLMTEEQIWRLSGDQLESLTPNQLGALDATQLSSLSSTQRQAFKKTQLEALSVEQREVLSISAMNEQAIKNMSIDEIKGLPPHKVKALTYYQLSQMSREQVGALPITLLDPWRIRLSYLASKLSPEQIDGLTSEQVKVLELQGVPSPLKIPMMSGDEVKGLSKPVINRMLNHHVRAFRPDQIAIMSTDQIRALSRGKITGFSREQIGAMSPTQFQAIIDENVERNRPIIKPKNDDGDLGGTKDGYRSPKDQIRKKNGKDGKD